PADRAGTGVTQLHAVVLGRVVRGGEHHPGGFEHPGGEIEPVGRAEAHVDDVGAPPPGAVDERLDELLGAVPHVVAYDDLRTGEVGGGCEVGEGGAEAPGDLGGEVIGNEPANV